MMKTPHDNKEAHERVKKDNLFVNHDIVIEAQGKKSTVYYCRHASTTIGAFRVCMSPGYLAFFGDYGEVVINKFTELDIEWLRSAVDSHDYLFSKISQSCRGELSEYSFQLVESWLDALEKEVMEAESEENHELWRKLSLSEETSRKLRDIACAKFVICPDAHCEILAQHFTSDLWAGDDPPTFVQYSTSFYIFVEAMRWFANHEIHDAEPIGDDEDGCDVLGGDE